MRPLALALPCLLAGCLPPTLPPTADAAGPPTEDAGPPPSLRIARLTVEAFDGREWPPEAIPRRPVIWLEWTVPPRVDPDAEPPVYLLRGAPDEALLDDLEAAPLRAEHRGRIVPTTLVAGAARWKLVAETRLARGAELTIAVGGWLRAEASSIEAAETIGLRVDPSPASGAEVTDTWPPAGTSTVSPELDVLALRFDGPTGPLVEGGVALFEGARPEDANVATADCATIGWPDGWCVTVTPTRPLRRGSAHGLLVAEAQTDVTGAPIGPFEATFTTASEGGAPPPAPRLPTACALDERVSELGCVLEDDERVAVRLDAGEPLRWWWRLGDREISGVAPRGIATLALGGLPAAGAFEGRLELVGTGGVPAIFTVPVQTTEPLAALAIVEVRADPIGAEPTQEYVELLNYGAVPLSIDGYTLTDRADAIGDLLAGSIAPHERVLVVHPRFDPDAPEDGPIPPGVRLVRLDGPIGAGGIANAGEPLYLRDAAGRRISEAPALAAAAGACIVRGGGSMRAADGFGVAPCTPGTP